MLDREPAGDASDPDPFAETRATVLRRLFGDAPVAAAPVRPRPGPGDRAAALGEPFAVVPRAGDIVARRYRLLDRLGAGGTSSVWRAEQLGLARPVALKLLHDLSALEGTAATRMFAEANILSRLDHPHVVRVLDVGDDQGRPYLAMEVVEGVTLDVWLARHGPISPRSVLAILDQLADGLGAAHALGLVHRDVKPSNVIVGDGPTGEPFAKLLDFGLARWVALDEASRRLTRSGAVYGTPGYVSPESLRGEPVEARADVYGLGCLGWELLAGRPAFVGDSVERILFQQLFCEPPLLRSERGEPIVDRATESFVQRCLQRRPEYRFDDMAAVRAAICRVRAGEVVIVPNDAARERDPRASRARRPPSWRVLVGSMLCAAAAFAALNNDDARVERMGPVPPAAPPVRGPPAPVPAAAPRMDSASATAGLATTPPGDAPRIEPSSQLSRSRGPSKRPARSTADQSPAPAPSAASAPDHSTSPNASRDTISDPVARPRDWSDPFARRRLSPSVEPVGRGDAAGESSSVASRDSPTL
jgi:serine/threonine protein kinase